MTTVSRGALQPADHIYTQCSGGLYYHHGIYVGKAKVTNPNNKEEQEIDDAVIHFLGPGKKKGYSKPQCTRCFYIPQMQGIVITCLDCFGEGYPLNVYIYNASYLTVHLFMKSGTCSTWPSHPPRKVIGAAFSLLEKKIDFGEYNLLFNNCEDFATFCKTGYARSNQVAELFSLPGSIAYSIMKGVFYGN